jgi:hypothetical protein
MIPIERFKEASFYQYIFLKKAWRKAWGRGLNRACQ